MQKMLAVLISVVLLCSCTNQQTIHENDITNKIDYAPDYGGTLKIFSYNSDTLNPLYTRNKANAQMLMLIFDSLIKCDEAQRPVPVLASGFSVSADGLVWTVNLRNNIKWHDGSAFTANDAVATLNAVRSSSRNSPYKDNLRNVSRIESSGNSLIITLSSPQTNFLNLLEIPVVKASDVNSFTDYIPVGTGKYSFTEKTNKIIYLNSNKSWWGENIPYIDNIEVYLLPDKITSVYAFEAKEIDMVTADIKSLGDFSGSAAEGSSAGYNSGRFNFLSFNLNNKYLSDNTIRVAFAHAINKNRIFEEVMLSHGSLTDSFLNPNWWVYNHEIKKYTFDPGLAINLIAEKDLKPNDIQIELLINDDNNIRIQIADIIKEQLNDIGINIKIKAVTWEDYISLISRGSYDMYLGEINFSPEINPQYVLQDTEHFSTLLQQLRLQTTDEGRKTLYNEIQYEYAEFLPSLPLYFDLEALLYNNKIHGEIKPLRNNIFDNAHNWYILHK